MSDVFREVNEDLRREQMKRLWRRFGPFVIGGAVLIVVAVAGYQWYQSVQNARAADSGDRYLAAINAYSDGNAEAALETLRELIDDGYREYPALARMAAANIEAELGNIDAAVELFDAVAADGGADAALRAAAEIRAAYTLVGTVSFSDIRERVSEFNQAGNAYRLLALEVLAVAAIDAGNYDQALGWASQMLSDPYRSQASDQRAQLLLAYVSSRVQTQVPAAGPADAPAIEGFEGEVPAFGAGNFGAGEVPGFDAAPGLDGLDAPGFDAPAADAPADAPADEGGGFANPDAFAPADDAPAEDPAAEEPAVEDPAGGDAAADEGAGGLEPPVLAPAND